VREISRSEAIVTSELLAGPGYRRGGAGEERVPRRTRDAIRQRLLERDSIAYRYVPDPSVLGRPILTFVIAQPYAEAHALAVSTWLSQPEGAHIWGFKDTLFGLFMLHGTEEAESLRIRLSGPETHRYVFAMDCDARLPIVPVFFDFGASWARITGLAGTMGYPHSLPATSVILSD
jgi:hypothetical protein